MPERQERISERITERLAERIAVSPPEPRGSGCGAGCLLPLGLLAGGLLVGGALALRFRLDPLLERAYDGWRPRIEQLVGQVMGHPLELGAYRGIGPEGLRVGPSRFRAGPEDGSTITAQEIQVRVHPLASWRQRGLVLDLDIREPVVDLRPNSKGWLWVLGRLKPGEPPRLDLRIRVPKSGKLRIWNVTPQGKPLAFQFHGEPSCGSMSAASASGRTWPRRERRVRLGWKVTATGNATSGGSIWPPAASPPRPSSRCCP